MVNMIIGAIDNYKWDQIKYWCNSIEMSGFEGRKVIIGFNLDKETYQTLVQRGFEVVTPGAGNPDQGWTYKFNQTVHLDRFIHIWAFLRQQKDVEYVVTTDVRDIVFQLDPCKFISENSFGLVCGTECLKYKDEAWGKENYQQTFGQFFYDLNKDAEIYNVGAFGGEFEYVKDMCLMIYQTGINRPIPICDQAVFNFLLQHEPYKSNYEYFKADMKDGWAIHCGTVLDPGKIAGFAPNLTERGNLEWVLPDGTMEFDAVPAVILHQYDRVPELKLRVEAKYGN